MCECAGTYISVHVCAHALYIVNIGSLVMAHNMSRVSFRNFWKGGQKWGSTRSGGGIRASVLLRGGSGGPPPEKFGMSDWCSESASHAI